MRTALHTTIRPMTADDIVQVTDVERESFPSMWPQTAYKRELTNKLARYLVLTEARDAPVEPPVTAGLWSAVRRVLGSGSPAGSHQHLLGFIGVWLMAGEAHIVTVAVRERYRRRGIGERLVIAILELALQAEQESATLEVRASNDAAQRLYEKYGFARLGRRTRYYTDNNEDAVIMTAPDLFSEAFRSRLAELRALHRARYADLWD